jgi:outer membrane protein
LKNTESGENHFVRYIMNRKILLLLLLTGFCLLSALTLDEAKQLALKNNPKYLAAKNAYDSARWSKNQALSSMLPSLTASGSYVYLDPATVIQTGMSSLTLNHDIRSGALTLSQPIFLGGKLWQAYRISGISAEIAKLSLESMRLTILGETESKYLGVLQLQELQSIAEKDLQSSDQNLAIAQVRFDNGTLSRADLLKIQAKKASKEVALIQAQTALDLAIQEFFNYIDSGEFDLEPVSLSKEDTLINQLTNWNQRDADDFTAGAVLYARDNNLSLKITDNTVKLSKKAYNIARGNFLPTVMLSASRSFSENGLDRYEFDVTKNTVALTASIPLLPQLGNYAGARKAYYDMQKSWNDWQTAANSIRLGVSAAALNLVSSARQVKASRLAYDYTQQTYEQMLERYRNNMLSATEMLDVEVMLQAAAVSKTNAEFSYLKARSTLMQALGTDDQEVLSSLWK